MVSTLVGPPSSDTEDASLVIDANRLLSLPIGLRCLNTIVGRDAQIVELPGLMQKATLSQAVLWISEGRLRAQISSASGSAKLSIMIDYNAVTRRVVPFNRLDYIVMGGLAVFAKVTAG
jgi:hypothetical protein